MSVASWAGPWRWWLAIPAALGGIGAGFEVSSTGDFPSAIVSARPTGQEPREVPQELSDAELLDFIRNRSTTERVTRDMVFLDYGLALQCDLPKLNDRDQQSPHRNQAIHVYTNPLGKAAMWDPYEKFPAGSLIVKEKLNPYQPQGSELFTAMYKREAGYDSEHGDWEYFLIDGAAQSVVKRGQLTDCRDCHAAYQDSDFVSKNYAARALPPFAEPRSFVIRENSEWSPVQTPVCWSGSSVVYLPAAWAELRGPDKSRAEATSEWRQLQNSLPAAPDSPTDPPEDLAPWGGPRLRFEPSPQKNTLGYWTEVADSAEWSVAVTNPGTYEVQVLQGCGTGQGGSRVDIQVADQRLEFQVRDTGHFQNFVWMSVGTIEVRDTSVFRLAVKPRIKAAAAVMDIRQIKLVRITR